MISYYFIIFSIPTVPLKNLREGAIISVRREMWAIPGHHMFTTSGDWGEEEGEGGGVLAGSNSF
jgi:hypothetical protein